MKYKCFSGRYTCLATLKTWVRIPGLDVLHIILHSAIPCNVQDNNVPCIFTIQRPRVPDDQTNGVDLRNT